MTLSNLTTTIEHTAVGTAAETFNIPFPFAANSEIYLLEAAVLQAQGTIYTLTGAGTSTGGTVTYVGTPTASAKVRINRVVANTQTTNLAETGAFSAEAVEDTLDKTVQQAQQSLQLDTTDGETYDAGAGSNVSETRKIVNVTDPTTDQDVATKTYVDAAISGSGNVPTPVAGDTGRHLEATGAGTTAWAITEEVPTPVSADVTANKVLQATSAAVNGFSFQEVPARGGRANNLLMNGQFSVAQQGVGPFTDGTVPLNSDDTLVLDRWRLLSNGNNTVDVSQSTAQVPNGALNSILLDVETANLKFGIISILENKDTVRAFQNQNGTVSVSFEAFVPSSESIATLRAGILSWVGTADSVTSDVVDSWSAAGTDPTLVTSWAYENTPAALTLVGNTWTTFAVTDVALNTSGTTNMALFIWTDDTVMTAGHLLYISNVQMVMGSVVGQYPHRPHAEELALCQRYLQVIAAGAAEEPFGMGFTVTTTTASAMIPLPTTMRAKPTAVVIDSAVSDFRVANQAATDACSAIAFATATPNAVKLDLTTTGSWAAAGEGVMLEAVNSSAKLTFSAEL